MHRGNRDDRRWVAIAANPYSGMRPNRKAVEQFAETLKRHGLKPRIIWDPLEREVLLQDPDLPRQCRCVVAAGGDGTVCTIINDKPVIPLAVLPLGSENLFASEMGFTADAEALAQAIAIGRTRSVDLGCVRGRRFSLMVSVGFDAEVVRRVGLWRAKSGGLKRVNRLSYLKPILEALFRYPFEEIELEADGARVRGTHAFIFNLPRYPLPLALAHDAQSDDGLLDWIVLERPGALNIINYFWRLRRRKSRRRPDIIRGRARIVRITGVRTVPVQLDGDPFGFTPVEAQAVPGALQVITAYRTGG